MALSDQIPLPWQRQAWRQLQESRRQQRLSHALLFSGPAGLGKSLLAQTFARGLLCRQPDDSGHACGHCRDCRLLAAGSHPDYHRITPEESSRIGVDAIRTLQEESTLVVGESRSRVFLVDPAHAMTTAAANALLKTLEEPPQGIHLLLVSSRPERLPVTIRSRCQRVAMRLPPAGEAVSWLQQQENTLSNEQAAELLQLAAGGPLAALALIEQGLDSGYQECREQWISLAHGRASPSEVAEQWLQGHSLETLLRMLTIWVTAMIRVQAARAGSEPLGPQLIGAVTLSGSRNLYHLLDKLIEAQTRLTHNPNPQLVLESLLIDWQQITES